MKENWANHQLFHSYNQQDPESRTEFLHEVAKKLAQIEEPLERQTYLTSAANRFMIRKNDLENLVNRYGLGYQYEQVNEQYKTAPETAAAEKEKKYEKPATETSSYLACGTS